MSKKSVIESQHFTGERACFKSHNICFKECLFDDGESPIKESQSIECNKCTFGWKYPLWYGDDLYVEDCHFLPMARAGIWYSTNVLFKNCQVEAPKLFRRCSGIDLENIDFKDGSETLWYCQNIKLKSIKVDKDYFGLNCSDVYVENIQLTGNYGFDGCKNLVIKNSILHTKDAFWNCENVYLENCEIVGEYFGWNSKNVTLVNCSISSHQGFCYIENLVLREVDLKDSDLTFEYCKNVTVVINSNVVSIKNPISGIIKAKHVGEIIQDDPAINTKLVHIEVEE